MKFDAEGADTTVGTEQAIQIERTHVRVLLDGKISARLIFGNPAVTAPLLAAFLLHDFNRAKTHKSPGEPRLATSWKNGAGEAIRTPDPNLGKHKIAPFARCLSVSHSSLKCTRVRVSTDVARSRKLEQGDDTVKYVAIAREGEKVTLR